MDEKAEYLTTKELAELLRIKERKVYDLAASGEVPCVRAVGKLLFPRAEILAWMNSQHSGPDARLNAPAPVIAGSHDPLLDWALRQSGCGLATYFDGSHDGLERVAKGQAQGCGLHIHQPGGWNVDAVQRVLGSQPVVLVEFARRERGLLLAADNHSIEGIADLAGHRFARRQNAAASQRLFEALAREAGLDPAALAGPETPARTEDDVALSLVEGKADAAFGLQSVARQFNLRFVPVTTERFDLLVWRQAWFDPAFQTFLDYWRSDRFEARAAELGGYDVSGRCVVHFNGPI